MPADSMPDAQRSQLNASGGSWLLALLAPALALSAATRPALLSDPSGCPGLVDWLLIVVLRSVPTMAIGSLLWWTHAAMVLAATTGFWILVRRQGAHPLVAAGLAAGFAFTLPFAFALTPTPVGAYAAATLVLCCIRPHAPPAWSSASLLSTMGLALFALMAPAMALPAGVAAGLLVWIDRRGTGVTRRAAAAIAAAMATVIAPSLLMAAVPGPPPLVEATVPVLGCVPALLTGGATAFGDGYRLVLDSTGPLVLTLALFGAFADRTRAGDPRVWVIAALAAVSLLISSEGDSGAAAPALVSAWVLAAAGVGALARASLARGARPVAAWTLGLAIPLLTWAATSRQPVDPDETPLGHESLSRTSFARLLGTLPDKSALVEEDAVSELLLRSLDGWWQATGKDLALVPRDADAIRAALRTRGVYALPRAQRSLQHRGVRLSDGGLLANGAATVLSSTPCAALAGSWMALPDADGLRGFAVVAGAKPARGPFLIYAGGHAALDPAPADWPPRTRRGFFAEGFTTATEDERARLGEALARDGAPADRPVMESPFVVRLELWRTPDAPLALAVAVSSPVSYVLARTVGGPVAPRTRLCASFPFDVGRF